MKIILIFTYVTLTLGNQRVERQQSQSRLSKKQQLDQIADGVEYEYINQDPGYLSLYEDSSKSASHHQKPKTGFSVGGGLVSIAQGAANAAHNSVINQPSAAGQAAYVAKNTLAQSAAQSAATAAAALAGKQIILMGLEQQSYNAHLAVDSEKTQLQQAQRSATAAQNTAQQAMHQVQVITTALNAAQATAEHATQAASEAAAELAAQTTMVGQAKARAHAIDEQLETARVDFEATQAAAQKAAALAQKAQNNAAAAAAHAAHAASEAAAHSIGTKHDRESLQDSLQHSENINQLSKVLRDSNNLYQASSQQESAPHHKSSSLIRPTNEEHYSADSFDTDSPHTTSALSPSSYSASGPLDYDYKSSTRVVDYRGY
ncbi:uncharacterized protein LOC117169104 [Belonocnema kinseyi]|uniref:uncharacterized protein LOC117169104 n=1 Tax=Belonocnema kinseyi TaxID=2817044 RepID=UPI00143DB506|nr:uncharacterized protein LOC117169104 [Belonocnema kinseyi]XP_033211138.1 uncharacterized protein LOC117169104 [Belonocnema kinseyi]XP_033211139.1 uncharacterized protein LOC117169104 [Belonocnema kinseyi]XP_033211140.1 uncharacterized protein LOC117169104 [Belonocnema kinseyi]